MLFRFTRVLHRGPSKILDQLLVSTQQLTTSVSYKSHTDCLTSCAELSRVLGNVTTKHNYRVLDVTFNDLTDNRKNHFNRRIPGSKFFDLLECRNQNSPYPVMLPSAQQFADYVGELGVENTHHVVVYEDFKDFMMIPSARLWWMFRVFGHNSVSVLNGGLRGWIDAGNAVASGEYENEPDQKKNFIATYHPELVATFDKVKEYVNSKEGVLLEARDASHMDIDDSDGDISSKSVPGALWTPFSALLDSQKNSVREAEEILNFFSSKGVDLNDELVSTCEVGFTASSLAFCLYYARGKEVAVYDGSFSEWVDRMPL